MLPCMYDWIERLHPCSVAVENDGDTAKMGMQLGFFHPLPCVCSLIARVYQSSVALGCGQGIAAVRLRLGLLYMLRCVYASDETHVNAVWLWDMMRAQP